MGKAEWLSAQGVIAMAAVVVAIVLSGCASAPPVVSSDAICPEVPVWSKTDQADLLSDLDVMEDDNISPAVRKAAGKPRFGAGFEHAATEDHNLREQLRACHAGTK